MNHASITFRPRSLSPFFVLLLASGAVRAEFPKAQETKTTRPYAAVAITAAAYAEPRPLRIWGVKIDLTSPDLDFAVTPRGKFETAAKTPLDFARDMGLQVTINDSPFGPIPSKAGDSGPHCFEQRERYYRKALEVLKSASPFLLPRRPCPLLRSRI